MQIRRGKWRGIKIGGEPGAGNYFRQRRGGHGGGDVVFLLYRDFSMVDSRGQGDGEGERIARRRVVFSGLLCCPIRSCAKTARTTRRECKRRACGTERAFATLRIKRIDIAMGEGEDESTFVSSTPGRKSQEENGWEGRRRMRKRDGDRQRARASSFGEKTRRWNMHAARPNSNDDRDNIMVSL